MNRLLFSFFITILAGFFTMLGAFVLMLFNKKSDSIITGALSFASSVMITISIVDLIPNGYLYISKYYLFNYNLIITIFFILLGMILSFILDKKITTKKDNKLYAVGLISLITIMLHNIPEGIATFIITNNDIKLGILLAISIAIHNIPEGICISMPIYYATNNKKLANFYTFIAAIAEPIGAVIAFLFLRNLNDLFIGLLFSFIGGLMIGISINELLPMALKYKKNKVFIIFLILGFLIMIFNHLLLC
ncbi:MAG: ZIP family metal transporter [Bacilli bacterium]